MNVIKYREGDATRPVGGGYKLLVHVCNDQGKWGKGFVLAISRRIGPIPERKFREWSRRDSPGLGEVQFVEVGASLIVANMVAQEGLYVRNGRPPIRYDALAECLGQVADYAEQNGCTIHMPRIGVGLAGGKWPRVAAILDKQLVQRGLSVTVYDWKG